MTAGNVNNLLIVAAAAQADQAAHLAVPGVGVAAVGIGFRLRLARIAVHQALQLLLVLGEAAQADGEGTELAHDGDHFGLLRRSEEHTSELQSLMRTSYAVLCFKKKK